MENGKTNGKHFGQIPHRNCVGSISGTTVGSNSQIAIFWGHAPLILQRQDASHPLPPEKSYL